MKVNGYQELKIQEPIVVGAVQFMCSVFQRLSNKQQVQFPYKCMWCVATIGDLVPFHNFTASIRLMLVADWICY